MLVGRGRGHVSTDRREQLRRPVDPTYVSPLDSIAAKIAALGSDSTDQLDAIKDDICKHCASVDKMKLMVSDLHERSLVNRKFGTKCAIALATQSQLTVDGKKLRTILMTNIQTDFEDKENLRHHNMNRFLNTFAFIGEVFRHIRLANGTPIAVLAIALVEYCKLLIGGTEPEVELCVQQLAYNGRLLKKWNTQQLAALQILIRSSCMVPGTDSRCLCWLHLACDLDRFNYGPLSSELCELYKAKLDASAMEAINELLVAPDPVVVPEESDEVSALNGIHIDGREEKSSSLPPPKETALKKHTGHSGGGDFAPPDKPMFAVREPRPPRFNPGSDRRSDPRSDPATWLPRHGPMSEKDRGIWGISERRSTGGSYGHDDRFDKEEDFYHARAQRNTQPRADKAPAPSAGAEESWD